MLFTKDCSDPRLPRRVDQLLDELAANCEFSAKDGSFPWSHCRLAIKLTFPLSSPPFALPSQPPPQESRHSSRPPQSSLGVRNLGHDSAYPPRPLTSPLCPTFFLRYHRHQLLQHRRLQTPRSLAGFARMASDRRCSVSSSERFGLRGKDTGGLFK